MKMVKPICILFILFLVGQGASAKVSLPSMFSDNMVLQQKTNAAIWGTAAAGKRVQVTTSWNKKQYTTTADSKGNWKVKVLTVGYGGPYSITISDGEPFKLNNILLGEVWLCSGQSNMEMPLAGWGKIDNYEQEGSENTSTALAHGDFDDDKATVNATLARMLNVGNMDAELTFESSAASLQNRRYKLDGI